MRQKPNDPARMLEVALNALKKAIKDLIGAVQDGDNAKIWRAIGRLEKVIEHLESR